MLVEFSVTNFRSIRDKQTLSMVKGKGSEHEATHTFKPTAPGSETLLKSAAIYGANAAGKSNIIKAISTMRKMVISPDNPYEQVGDGEYAFFGISEYQPFKFQEVNIFDIYPTEFEVVFIKDNVRYQYGFSFDSGRVISEWLFAFPSGRVQRWLEREYVEDKYDYNWNFSSSFLGDKQHWVRITREYELFLTKATNIKQMEAVRLWFKEDLVEINDLSSQKSNASDYAYDVARILLNNKVNIKEKLHRTLKDLGTKINSLSIIDVGLPSVIETFEIDDNFLALDSSEEMHEVREFSKVGKYKLYANYSVGDKYYRLDFWDESDGTKRLVWLLSRLIFLLEKEKLIIIDEINAHFHPMLIFYLINLFHSSEGNKRNAQLIFTTHETSVLDQDVMRRDQIWFCEKDENQATRLYSLLDFKPRKGYENLEAAYLAGRYGAVPMIQAL